MNFQRYLKYTKLLKLFLKEKSSRKIASILSIGKYVISNKINRYCARYSIKDRLK